MWANLVYERIISTNALQNVKHLLFCWTSEHCLESTSISACWSLPYISSLQNTHPTFVEKPKCNLYCVFNLSVPLTVVCHIQSALRSYSIHLWLILVFQAVILERGYGSMKCDLCEALDSGAMWDGAERFPSPHHPPAPRMHEIEQNDSTHPYINYAPYAPPRKAHSVCKKRHIFRLNISHFEVWCKKLKCDICLLWLVLKACEVLTLCSQFQWVKLWGKVYSSLLLFSFHCLLLCISGREELFKAPVTEH